MHICRYISWSTSKCGTVNLYFSQVDGFCMVQPFIADALVLLSYQDGQIVEGFCVS